MAFGDVTPVGHKASRNQNLVDQDAAQDVVQLFRDTGDALRKGALMSQSPSEDIWRLDHYQYTNPVTGETYPHPIMTNGRCRVIVDRRGPFGHRFTYEEMWADIRIEFSFQAVISDQLGTTYQVLLAHAFENHPELWTGTPRDAELLRHLMSNIRQALCLLKSGPSDETRIRTVEFVLSSWLRWKEFASFQIEERVR
jgi:hypothetical protein